MWINEFVNKFACVRNIFFYFPRERTIAFNPCSFYRVNEAFSALTE